MSSGSVEPTTTRSRSSMPLVIAVIALAISTAVFAALYFLRGSGDGSSLTQKGTVKAEGQGMGDVFYPVPYSSSPALKVEPGTRYVIVRQSETGFTWCDRARMVHLSSDPDVAAALAKMTAAVQTDAALPDLTWEATGLRGSANSQSLKTFEQSGTFISDFGQQGQVNFPIPYASPPNVELSGNHKKTVIVECTATGFKWKNGGNAAKDWMSDAGTVTWKAKGIRATNVPGS